MLAHKRSAQRRYVADGRPPSRAQIGIFSASSSSRRHELIIAPIRQGACHEAHPTRYSRSRCVSDQRTATSGGKAAVLAPTGPAVVIAGAVTYGARSMNSFPSHNSTRARWRAAANRVRRSGRCRLTLLTALAGRHPQQPEICGSAWEPSCPERGSRRRPGKTLTRQSSGPLKQDRLPESDNTDRLRRIWSLVRLLTCDFWSGWPDLSRRPLRPELSAQASKTAA